LISGTNGGSADLDAVICGCLKSLAAGDDSARAKLLEICDGRLRELAHTLLGKFARVRRWDNTDDVAQGAAIRLHRALAETVPDSPRGLMALMATQIQRELLDLARKHSGPMSYAANHGTNVRAGTSGDVFLVDEAADGDDAGDDAVPLERWEKFHQAVEKLPEEHREVFKMAWYLGADRPSVAKALGMSLRTVERRWQEARGMVRGMLDSNEDPS
jgi:RNA polymerase sigma factor (sigma-70 family)